MPTLDFSTSSAVAPAPTPPGPPPPSPPPSGLKPLGCFNDQKENPRLFEYKAKVDSKMTPQVRHPHVLPKFRPMPRWITV